MVGEVFADEWVCVECVRNEEGGIWSWEGLGLPEFLTLSSRFRLVLTEANDGAGFPRAFLHEAEFDEMGHGFVPVVFGERGNDVGQASDRWTAERGQAVGCGGPV